MASFIPTGEVKELARSMSWLIDNPAERAEMGRRGRQRMEEHYELRHLIRLHEALYLGMPTGESRR